MKKSEFKALMKEALMEHTREILGMLKEGIAARKEAARKEAATRSKAAGAAS